MARPGSTSGRSSSDKASAAYHRALAESTQHHQSSKTFSGKFLRPHGPFVKALVAEHGIKSILDYGCGKGVQYSWVNPENNKTLEEYWGVEVTKFDPAYEPFSKRPTGKFDLVICTHVLPTIPVDDLPWFIREVIGYSSKAVYFAEKMGPPKKSVLSTPELHPINWSVEEWLAKLKEHIDPAETRDIHAAFRIRSKDEGVLIHRFRFADGSWWEHHPTPAPW